jgi:hypothetical protein
MSSINSHKIAKYSKLLNNTSDSSMAAKYRQKLGYYHGQSGGQWDGLTQAQIATSVSNIDTRIGTVIEAMEAAKTAIDNAQLFITSNPDNAEGIMANEKIVTDNIAKIDAETIKLKKLQDEMFTLCKVNVSQQILKSIPELKDCNVAEGEPSLFSKIVAKHNLKLVEIRGGPVEVGASPAPPAPPAPAPGTETPNLTGGYYNYNETEDIGNWVNRLIN